MIVYQKTLTAVSLAVIGATMQPLGSVQADSPSQYSIKKLSVRYTINTGTASVSDPRIIPFETTALGVIDDMTRCFNYRVSADFWYGFFRKVEVQATLTNDNTDMTFDWTQQVHGITTNQDGVVAGSDTGNGGKDWVADTTNFCTHKADGNHRVYTWDGPGIQMGAVRGHHGGPPNHWMDNIGAYRDKITQVSNGRELVIGTDQWSQVWANHEHIHVDATGNWTADKNE